MNTFFKLTSSNTIETSLMDESSFFKLSLSKLNKSSENPGLHTEFCNLLLISLGLGNCNKFNFLKNLKLLSDE